MPPRPPGIKTFLQCSVISNNFFSPVSGLTATVPRGLLPLHFLHLAPVQLFSFPIDTARCKNVFFGILKCNKVQSWAFPFNTTAATIDHHCRHLDLLSDCHLNFEKKWTDPAPPFPERKRFSHNQQKFCWPSGYLQIWSIRNTIFQRSPQWVPIPLDMFWLPQFLHSVQKQWMFHPDKPVFVSNNCFIVVIRSSRGFGLCLRFVSQFHLSGTSKDNNKSIAWLDSCNRVVQCLRLRIGAKNHRI